MTTEADAPADFDQEVHQIIERVQSETMTSPERVAALVQAVRYVDRYNIPGAIVECGVWRAGSSMAAALAHTARTRDLWLYDTFEGMSEPTEHDIDPEGRLASDRMPTEEKTGDLWAIAGLDLVRANMTATGYPLDKVHFVAGKVEDTIPATMPGPISILRLDTDWYESTAHELEYLIPLVVPHGVLIIDDYGHWQGARKAVDEWVERFPKPVLLNRIDYTGRIAVLS